MDSYSVGRLTFEIMDDGEEVTVKKNEPGDVGFATFIKCPESPQDWVYLKKNAEGLNGIGDEVPAGRWIVGEYVGRESCSANLEEKAVDGFSNKEIMAAMVAVNVIFDGEGFEKSLVLNSRRFRKRRRKPGVPEGTETRF